MKKVVSSVPEQRFKKFQVSFPDDWELEYIPFPYTDEDLIRACKGASYLFVMSTHTVSARVIQSCPHLKMIHVEGVGFDKVDIAAAKEKGIPVCNNKAVNNGAVAEHTIGLMLAALRRTPRCDREIKTRGFAETQKEFFAEGQHELANRHIGIIGIGAIGREVARRLIFWGCKISYYDVFRPDTETESSLNLAYLPLNELLASCDIISLHVPALPETVNMLSRPQFEMMKAGVLVINTARGELINAGDLAWALETGRVYGAALDTISPEPAPSDHPLLNLSPNAERRLILTPHAGGTTDEAFTRMLKNAVANILAVESGARPVNDVSR